jgi:ABC-2 type transport system permease protein
MLSQQFIAYKTIVTKEIKRFMRIWTQTLLPPVINQSLYFLIFGSFIGSQIGDMDGFTYMQFIVPGLIMMSIINSSFQNVVGSFYIAKFQKSIEELLVSPSSNITIISGYITGGVTRGLLVGFLVFLVSLFFTETSVYSPLIVIIFSILTSCLFSMLALINAIFAKSFDDTSIVTTFILAPLTYLGGVFYSIDRLPQVWQTISQFNPIVYMIDGIRYGFLGINTYPISFSLIIITTLLISITAFAYYFISKSHGLRS